MKNITEKKTAGRHVSRTAAPLLDISQPSSKVPRLIITGRGQLTGRKMHAMRLRPELLERLALVATGPTYLIAQVAIERLCEQLEAQEGIEVIKAEDLG